MTVNNHAISVYIMTKRVLVLLLLIFVPIVLPATLGDYEISCKGAKQTYYGNVPSCPFVDWQTANLYQKSKYSVYSTSAAESQYIQGLVAANTIKLMLNNATNIPSHKYDDCKEAITRFVCVETFPYCPIKGDGFASASYLPPCKLLCDQVNKQCNGDFICSSYSSKGCTMTVPDGHYLLSISKFSLDMIPTFYIALLIVWVVFTFGYVVSALVIFRKVSLPVCQAFIIAMLLKVLILIISQMFWSDCAYYGGVCVELTAGGLTILYHIYETGLFVFFLVLSRGFSITRENLTMTDWRFIVSLCTVYYTITVVSFQGIKPSRNVAAWAGFLIITYGIMYFYIYKGIEVEMKYLYSQVKRLTAYMPEVAVSQVHLKYNIYRTFLIIILIFIVIEIICHVFFAMHYDISILVLVYEITQFVCLFILGILLWPRPLSPFFFMTATSMNRDNIRFDDLEVRMADRTMAMVPIVEIADFNAMEMQTMPTSTSNDEKKNDDPTVYAAVKTEDGAKEIEMTSTNNNNNNSKRLSILGSLSSHGQTVTQPTIPPAYIGDDEIELTSLFNNNMNRNIGSIMNRNANRDNNSSHSGILNTYYTYHEIPTANMNANALRSNTAVHNATTVRSTDQVKMVAVTTPDKNVLLGAFKTSSDA